MKKEFKDLYDEFIENQSDLELGLVHYFMAREKLAKVSSSTDITQLSIVSPETLKKEVTLLLQIAKDHFIKARQPELLKILDKIEVILEGI